MEPIRFTNAICPFCKHDFVTMEQDAENGEFSVVCQHCGAMGPTGYSYSMAITLWEYRPTEQ